MTKASVGRFCSTVQHGLEVFAPGFDIIPDTMPQTDLGAQQMHQQKGDVPLGNMGLMYLPLSSENIIDLALPDRPCARC